MKHLIGITGHMRAGKDTVAAYLVENLGYVRVGFADAVKSMALAIDPLVQASAPWGATLMRLSDLVVADGWEKAKGEDDVRELLQRLGTEAGRGILGDDIWIRALERRLETDLSASRVVIPDVRFPNEADFIVEQGGEVWKVERPGFDGDGHSSETYVDDIFADMVIANFGTVSDLHAQLKHRLGQAMRLKHVIDWAETDPALD